MRVDVTEVRYSHDQKQYQTTSFMEYHDGSEGLHSLKNMNAQIEYFYQQHQGYKQFFRIVNGELIFSSYNEKPILSVSERKSIAFRAKYMRVQSSTRSSQFT